MTHLFFYDLEEKELVVIMPRHGKVSDMDRMWCGDDGKGIFFLVCIKYGIEDTQRSEKERKIKITRFLERERKEK